MSTAPRIDAGDLGLPQERSQRKRTLLKRTVDIVLGSLGLLLALPVIACLVVVIRLDSPGPALFGQRRIGRLGRPFTLWKLRSMYQDSSQAFHLQAAQDWFEERASGGRYKTEADPRITRVGRYLRRSSFDELPQLFNVLRGEMSLVGPRPMMPSDRSSYERWYFEREAMKPGITGLWQVSGRERLSAPEMMVLDVRYVRESSLWFDIQIMARTVTTVIADLRRDDKSVRRAKRPFRVEEA
ncbi:MAG TPA: sugar transferase [Candidatus Dormibacteraeota bacterium]|nr:sugar transferase [Candidatus Dormibacteraeota bacterium]